MDRGNRMRILITIVAVPLFLVKILPRLLWHSMKRPALLEQIPDLFRAYVSYLSCRCRGMEF